MKIKYKGAVSDPSGYGQANRDYVQALYNRMDEDTLTVSALNHEYMHSTYYGEVGKLLQTLIDKNIDYDVVINHCVPSHIEQRTESNKFNVGYNTWETDKLPDHWVEKINRFLDMVLVPSEFNREVYYNSGINIPVEVVPHCLDSQEINNSTGGMDNQLNPFKDHFKFLSVFQWTERKNPIGLLKAYFTEFYGHDDVVLVIKSYRSNTGEEQKNIIKQQIKGLKQDMRLDPEKTPKIVFIGDLITKHELLSLYNGCDCFVLPTRGEGFGLPFAEAAAAGCKVVAPAQTGQGEILNGLETAYLTQNYFWTPVCGMPWIPNYNGLMNWIEPDLEEFKIRMRCAYKEENDLSKKHQAIGRMAQKYNHNKVGTEMLEAIEKHMR